MSIVIYNKRGKRNYKEERLIAKLKPLIEKRLKDNPEQYGNFKPATTYDELENMYNLYSSEDADFEEIEIENENEKNMAKKQGFEEDENEELLTDSKGLGIDDDDDEESDFVDPFNREEPIIRDYVTDGVSLDPDGPQEQVTQTEFDEPQTFDEAFELEDDMGAAPSNEKQRPQRQEREEKPEREPINPNFDDMSSAKKKKSTRKFAKYIVETVCMLSEKGFVWYANKEINEAKLTEYELKGEMDLSLLVSLEDGQEVTVKQFFQIQCLKAEQLAVIDKEEKEDLAESLAEVLMEKGVGPTPTQELMLIALKIFGGQAITLMTIKSQTNALLGQLRAMKKGEAIQEQGEYEPEQYTSPTPAPTPGPQQYEQQDDYEEENESFDSLTKEDEMITMLQNKDPLLLETEIPTKE